MSQQARQSIAERSDAELGELIRGGAEDGPMAEVYARHRSAVLAYARTCCRDAHTAEDLAAEAFARTLEAVRAGRGPNGPWRPYLLTVVRRTAMAWLDTARRAELTDDVEQWGGSVPQAEDGEEFALRGEEEDLVVRSFRSLPERWQAVLWHTLVEGESTHRVGTMMGLSASGVGSLAERAREGLREAYLTEHAHGPRAADECRRYGALMAVAVRRRERRPERHLNRHLAECPSCAKAFRDLTDLNSRLRVVLPGAVLLWGAERYLTSYAAAAAAPGGVAGAAGALPDPGAGLLSGLGTSKPLGIAGATLAFATAIGTAVYVTTPDASPPSRTAPPIVAQSPGVPPATPPVTSSVATETLSPTPGTTTPLPATSSPQSPSPTVVTAATASGDRTRLRIDSTGLCMEIPGGSRAVGAQPREAACNGAAHQEWDVIPQEKRRRVMLSNVGTGMCLAHTGTKVDGDPVTQVPCDPVDTLQIWTINRNNDKGTAGIFNGYNMYLGLKDWYAGAQGEPHDSLIATTGHYYLSPSLHFRTDW
ncbi:sigma-70 family RNA polymerase sigma factor [Streptomyces sp. NPDC090029]|uniref:sigma-70 family RNA polymerase sigma factor n=1 Tax=Streptomyces sp. NPDC090029 TaxID=3365924 RepID=UPI003814E52D